MRLLRALALAAAMLPAVCCDRFAEPAQTTGDTPKANITIAALAEMYRGSAVVITENLIIAGRVTSSDREGNFYRSFTVEQDGAAVEIMAGLTDLHNIWPLGSGVTVRLQGLALGEADGVKRLGLPETEYGGLSVGYIPSRVELDAHISRTHGPEPFGIPNYYATMLDRRMCGRLVRVVSIARADDDTADVWEGFRIFEDDENGTRIAVSVSRYARFAQQPVVGRGPVAISGILLYGRPEGADEDMFILKPRHEDDFLY